MSTSVASSTLLDGFGLLVHFLLEAEADYLCGVTLHQRSTTRTNYRSGYYRRKLSTPAGSIPLRVVHLKYFHPRPSILKRAKRLGPSVLETLSRIYANGASFEQAAALIEMLWVMKLPCEHLNTLSHQLSAQLESWRANLPAAAVCDTVAPLSVADAVYCAI